MSKFVMNVGYEHQMPDFTVIAPDMAEGLTRDKKLPMLWLLHDFGGDSNEWCRFGNLEGLARDLNAFIICPTGRVNYYVDSWEYSRYRSFIMEDMWDFVLRTFPVSTDPQDCFIAGNGMGGYGAVYYMLSYPGRFGHIISFDGDLEAPERFLSGDKEKFVFPDTFAKDVEYSLKVLIPQHPGNGQGMAIAARKGHPFYEANVRVVECLRENGYKVNFIQQEMQDDWAFWQSELAHVTGHIRQLLSEKEQA